uniref:Uncharacterized protein n=1 Tax=Peronospora matthiolae TaxID=2874970 RepID=A0AAV1UHW2_9STRA
MAEIRESPVNSGTHRARIPEPDAQNIVKGDFVGKLGQPSVEPSKLHVRNTDADEHYVSNYIKANFKDSPARIDRLSSYLELLSRMHKVSDWYLIKKNINIGSLVADAKFPSEKAGQLTKSQSDANVFAMSNLSPDAYDTALKRFKRDAKDDPDLAMFLSVWFHDNDKHLGTCIFSALQTPAYREKGIKLLIYMFQDLDGMHRNSDYVSELLRSKFDQYGSIFVDAIQLLYRRYHRAK